MEKFKNFKYFEESGIGISVPTKEGVVSKAQFSGQILFNISFGESQDLASKSFENLPISSFAIDALINRTSHFLPEQDNLADRGEIQRLVMTRLKDIDEELAEEEIKSAAFPVTDVGEGDVGIGNIVSAYQEIVSGEAAKNGKYGERFEDMIVRRVQLEALGFRIGAMGQITNGLHDVICETTESTSETVTVYKSPIVEDVFFGVSEVSSNNPNDNGQMIEISEAIFVGEPSTLYIGTSML